ncbi:MAG TPA: histidine--tRNA ligase [Clostridia bacterium]|nr:histidine--tRNA ligase [Clostridia bacterium]
MLTTRPRGTNDILPGDTEKWRRVEGIIHQICAEYGYQEIRTPIFEHTELFLRGVGETTDIVEKEMYTFYDRGERSLTLRPEGTAPTVRAFLEHNLHTQPLPVKLYYTGPMFRYGRPQAGRFRQFHQFGVEAFGTHDPAMDAEVICLAMDFYGRLGLKHLTLQLNSVGCPKCRAEHRQVLHRFLEPRRQELCPTCQGRLDRNPLRIFDCKSEICQQIISDGPTILASLCDDCRAHFAQVQKYLLAAGVAYEITPHLVRGLDYYTNTAFEIIVEGIGAQSAIGGGGRYNGLVQEIGGPPLPGIGFGLGLERIFLALEEQGVDLGGEEFPDVFVAISGPSMKEEAFNLVQQLRRQGYQAGLDYLDRSLKAQLKFAGKHRYRYVVILGEEELAREQVAVKDMASGEQQNVSIPELAAFLAKGLCRD